MQFKILLIWIYIFTIFINIIHAQTSDQDIFALRRQMLMNMMGDGIAILKSAEVKTRSNTIAYEFKQNNNFYYLTGFEEPQSAMFLLPATQQKFILFVRPRNVSREIWTGKRAGILGAMKQFAADTAFKNNQFEAKLADFLRGQRQIYTSIKDKKLHNELLNIFGSNFGDWPKEILDIDHLIHSMRLVKDSNEIKLLRKAIDITCEAHIEAMKTAKPGLYEYQLEAIIEYIFKKNGAFSPGFPSIIGSGPNTLILHYDTNTRKIQDNELILMDIGAEYKNYSADITRTIPANGKFNKFQRDIYNIVLRALSETIQMVAPGVALDSIKNHPEKIIKEGLLELGLIKDKNSHWQYRAWLPHGTTHWLGLDVHDVGGNRDRNGKAHILQAGMVLTIEPGIYIGNYSIQNLKKMWKNQLPKDELERYIEEVGAIIKKYAGIGIRIEDDILVTGDGYEVLSAKAPKEISDIESMMKIKSHLD